MKKSYQVIVSISHKGNGKKARRYRAIKGCGYDEMDRIDEQYQSLRR